MCPDKDAGAAVADAPETPVGPTEVPALPDQETEVTEPEAPQEPSEEASGTEQGEEPPEEQATDPLEATKAALLESLSGDPELADWVAKEGLSQELRDSLKGPEADKSEWEATSTRRARLETAGRAALAYTAPQVQATMTEWFGQVAGNVRTGAQGLLDSQEGSPDLLPTAAIVDEVGKYIQNASAATAAWASESFESSIFTALEKSGAHKFLSADDKAALKAGAAKLPNERAAEAVALYLGAAERAAPESFKKAATERAEKDAGLIASRQKLRDSLPKNGKRSKVKAPAAPTDQSKQARLDRLAYGQDDQGNRATEEDRKWLAAQN